MSAMTGCFGRSPSALYGLRKGVGYERRCVIPIYARLARPHRSHRGSEALRSPAQRWGGVLALAALGPSLGMGQRAVRGDRPALVNGVLTPIEVAFPSCCRITTRAAMELSPASRRGSFLSELAHSE